MVISVAVIVTQTVALMVVNNMVVTVTHVLMDTMGLDVVNCVLRIVLKISVTHKQDNVVMGAKMAFVQTFVINHVTQTISYIR